VAMTAGELLDARSDRPNTRQPSELICLIKIAQSASHPQGPPHVVKTSPHVSNAQEAVIRRRRAVWVQSTEVV
jgi:hypothetical protein